MTDILTPVTPDTPATPTHRRTPGEARNARIAAWMRRPLKHAFAQHPTATDRQGWPRDRWLARYTFQLTRCITCRKPANRNRRLRAGTYSLFCLPCWHRRDEKEV